MINGPIGLRPVCKKRLTGSPLGTLGDTIEKSIQGLNPAMGAGITGIGLGVTKLSGLAAKGLAG
ncbi:hypothetical protein [Thauera sp. SDU_THAU2]|uniref:hypothetical protein n=1 Tax=Thauera sp. SDU_THAU2 TaxID=3136633 RepID=UPI00311DA010